MAILYYEIKKNFLKPSILIFLIIFSIINIYKINISYRDYTLENYKGYVGVLTNLGNQKLYKEKLKGDINNEKIDFVMDYYKELLEIVSKIDYSTEYDENLYTGYSFAEKNLLERNVIPFLKYNYMYGTNILEIVEKAKVNIEFYSNISNTYEVMKNKRIINMYRNRELNNITNTRGMEYYFKYNFSSLLVILLLLLGLPNVFCIENETGMSNLISISKNKNMTIKMKFIGSFIYMFIISLYFLFLNLITIYIISGTDSFFIPLYGLKIFEFTPLKVSVASFIFYDFLMKFLVFLLLGGIILLVSYYLKQTMSAFLVGTVSITGLIIINDFWSTCYNPISLITNYSMVRSFECSNIFGFCILDYEISIFIGIVYLFVICFFVRKQAIKWY